MKISLPSLLLVLFVGLKLAHVIAWSWWWVLAPLWALPALAVISFVHALCWGFIKAVVAATK
jgi:hypothetical protein